jgi:hypothetical protein
MLYNKFLQMSVRLLDLVAQIRNTEHKAPCYVVFSIPLLPHLSWAPISTSAPYSRKPTAYIPSSM